MQEKANSCIGIFDSGIGGVTVLKEIIKILPDENYIYISDSKNNPYGDMKKEKIIKRCEEITKYLIENKSKVIVIACNTASAIASEFLRKKYKNIPIIAIEPAYKMVYDHNYDKETLVMATKGTIESEKFNLLYKKYNNHKTQLLECVGLAEIIEEGNKEKIVKYLDENIGKYKGKIENVELKVSGNAEFSNIPLVVLVNGGSASASEIVAGALQDHKRGVVVGETTFGKGSVQKIFPFGNQTQEALKLTIAKYYLPTGRSIQAVGITPDIVVAEGEVPSGPQNQLEFKEADLKRHLKNELLNEQTKTDSKGEKTDSTNKDITEDIIMKDIQLKSAIDVLKTWGVISQANTTSIK